MKRLLQITAVLAAFAAGCGGDSSSSDSAGGSAASGSAEAGDDSRLAAERKPAAKGTTIKTADSQFGQVLFSKSNRAVYYFDKESGKTPRCYGACAQAWPPVLTSGTPQAAGGAKAKLLGTTQRSNGKKQVTYKGHPLYFYVTDPRGEVECHNIDEFGGLWLAVKPSGGTPP